MTANDLFAAAPELMKKWAATSVAIASSLEPTLIRLERFAPANWRGLFPSRSNQGPPGMT
jgi:hypothetical protein